MVVLRGSQISGNGLSRRLELAHEATHRLEGLAEAPVAVVTAGSTGADRGTARVWTPVADRNVSLVVDWRRPGRHDRRHRLA